MGSKTYNFRDEIKKNIEESRDLKHEIIDKHVNEIMQLINKLD